MPAPGQLLVSPALSQALRGVDGPTLSAYLGGFDPSGTIGSDGLSEPGEWFAYLGRAPSMPVRIGQASPVVRFAPSFEDQGSLTLETMIVVILGTIALILPILVFVATVTRLSAATREARYAAVRLTGATQRQLRGLIAVESGLTATLGAALGLVWFLIGRIVLAHIGFNGQQWYPADVWPGKDMVLLVVVCVIAFSVGISGVTMRRVEVSPLGVSRRAPRTPRRLAWVVTLAAGSALLGMTAWGSNDLAKLPGPLQFAVIGLGLALTVIGLAGSARALAWRFAAVVARHAWSGSSLLAARRLESDPGATGRVVASVVLLLALGGVARAETQSSLLNDSQLHAAWALALPADAVLVTPYAQSDRASQSLAVPIARLAGVRGIETTHKLSTGGRRPHGATLIVRTDGSEAVANAIRSLATWTALVETPAEMQAAAGASPPVSGYTKLLGLAVFFLLTICMATVLVSSIDWMSERRRSLAILCAIGVPSGVLRRSVMMQVILPLVVALAAGVAGALVVSWLLFETAQRPIVLAGGQLLATTAAVGALIMLTTAATLPWVGWVSGPEVLRGE